MSDEIKGRDLLLCPVCEGWVPHRRGYLIDHEIQIQRGQLVTGARYCDGSSTRPPMNLKTVTFTGTCPNCLHIENLVTEEKFPGSLPQYGGTINVQCSRCGPEMDRCSNCDRQLHQAKSPNVDKQLADSLKEALGDQVEDAVLQELLATAKAQGELAAVEVWVDRDNDPCCPDGEDHQPEHYSPEDRPVLLSDTHIIVERSDSE